MSRKKEHEPLGVDGKPADEVAFEPFLDELFPVDSIEGIQQNLHRLLDRYCDGKMSDEAADTIRKILAESRAAVESRHRMAPKIPDAPAKPSAAAVASGGKVREGPWAVRREG